MIVSSYLESVQWLEKLNCNFAVPGSNAVRCTWAAIMKADGSVKPNGNRPKFISTLLDVFEIECEDPNPGGDAKVVCHLKLTKQKSKD